MNILFFLRPKHEVCAMKKEYTVRQAIEKLRVCGYAAVPVLDDEGHYVGTLTEGDLLYAVAGAETPKEWEKISIMDIMRQERRAPVRVEADINDLLHLALTQNFVPVVDDRGAFIGIVTRQDIMRYFIKE
ncbi:MAG: CBS domain-containing protein [Clostridiales bacterium]|nr:CBS domain-containing protein [Clostridiales bacterium]